MPPLPNAPAWPMGKATVATAGTPVDLLTASGNSVKLAATTSQKLRVANILFAVIGGLNVNTGFIYIGVKGMNKGTGAGVIIAIPAAGAGVMNWVSLAAVGWGGGNEFTPEDLVIDGDTNGNSCQITLFVY